MYGEIYWYALIAVLLVLTVWLALNLIDSPVGRALRAVHGSEVAAQVVGVHTLSYKVLIFVVSAVLAALGGALTAHYSGFVTPDLANFIHSIEFVTMVVLGGMASTFGAVVGAVILTLLPQFLTGFNDLEMVIFGRGADARHHLHAQGSDSSAHTRPAQDAIVTALLESRALTKSFGGVDAVSDLSFAIRDGYIHSIIGPNGAGKTTLLNTLSGVQPMSGGRIVFDGEDIGRLKAPKRVTRGIAQVPEGRQIFGPMSVADNLALGAYTRGTGAAVDKDKAWIYALFPMLGEKRRQAAGMLSGGQQQMLAIGRALLGHPDVKKAYLGNL